MSGAQKLKALIDAVPDAAPLHLSANMPLKTWDDLANARDQSRALNAEGLMLKRRDSPYLAGKKAGGWWKWKIDPLNIDAVLIYAQAGHGRWANPFTDYTFAMRDGNDLVSFTKADSGLTDAEFRGITAWVRKNKLQRFGPVRQVPAEHVFEIAFEGIQSSPRHKSGVALRFPGTLRWRRDKPVGEANTLNELKKLLATFG
jgi:DNA ligase-1